MTLHDITPGGPGPRRNRPRPLLLTADPVALDDVLALADQVGTEIEVIADVGAARARWAAAPLVVVGADLAGDVVRRRFPRRAGVLLLGSDLDDASVWEPAIALGAEQVVFLPEATGFVGERLARCGGGAALGPAPTICVIGGRGGAGASTLAVALATTASRRGLRSMLIDGDPLGGGLDLVLGEESTDGARWSDLLGVPSRVGDGGAVGHVPSRVGDGGAVGHVPHTDTAWWGAALPRVGGLQLLSWDRGDVLTVPGAAMAAALEAGRSGSDVVVVDLPRYPDVAAEVALAVGGPVLLVVPAEFRATVAAARVARSLAGPRIDLRVVVRGPSPSRLSAALVASSLGLPLAGYLRPEPGIATDLERGHTPGGRHRSPLASFCSDFLDELCLDVAA
ncbi:MAG: septum site-determining protein Ssd [Sporichthyaceae bacterium]